MALEQQAFWRFGKVLEEANIYDCTKRVHGDYGYLLSFIMDKNLVAESLGYAHDLTSRSSCQYGFQHDSATYRPCEQDMTVPFVL